MCYRIIGETCYVYQDGDMEVWDILSYMRSIHAHVQNIVFF